MCLSMVDEKPQRKSGVGYKVLEKKDGQYLSWDYIPNAGTKYPMGEWIKDHKRNSISTYGGVDYKPGYHIALSKPIRVMKRNEWYATILVMIKCRFRKVVATGYDGSYGQVVVAREMMLLEEVK